MSSSTCSDAACVQVAVAGHDVFVRDGKDPNGAVLSFTQAEWAAFLSGAKLGEFDFS